LSDIFRQLNFPKFKNVYSTYERLIDNGTINWPKAFRQICLNTSPEHPNDIHYGCGSLYYDWANSKQITDENGKVLKYDVPTFDVPKQESEFTQLNDQFKGCVFEEIYYKLTEKYSVGRVRLMESLPKTCLSWHTDDSTRIHFPIKTQDGCFMVIEDTVKHMPVDTWWYTDTTRMHTAFNSSTENRIHLVAVLLGDKF
jgi:hypothetical protein